MKHFIDDISYLSLFFLKFCKYGGYKEKKSLLYIKFKNFIIFLTLKKMCDHPKFLLGPI